MKLRNVFLTIVALFVFAAAAVAASNPARLAALTDKGTTVSLKLDDGSTLNVARRDLKIRDARRTEAKGHKALTANDLASGSLPAAVSVIYRKDGTVRKVRVNVFASEDEARAFVERRQRTRTAHNQ